MDTVKSALNSPRTNWNAKREPAGSPDPVSAHTQSLCSTLTNENVVSTGGRNISEWAWSCCGSDSIFDVPSDVWWPSYIHFNGPPETPS